MDYEDELDRMRSQKRQGSHAGRRTAAGISENRPPESRQPDNRQIENRRRTKGSVEPIYDQKYAASQGDRTYYQAGDGRNPRARSSGGKRQADELRQKARQEKLRKKKKKKFISTVLLVAAAVIAVYFLFLRQSTHQEGYWTIAVFGVDSRDGKLEKGALSDVEMVCNIDKATGEIKLVSVFRDTYLKIDSKGTYHKINEAYFKGGHEQAISALNENLDLKIDDYATFNWRAVADAINILGGVDIEITDAEFSYINGFITETVNSTGIGSYQLEHAGMNHLDGVQAVAYARLRLMDTDFNRTERQRKVVTLALEKAKQADFSTLKTLVATILPQIKTSIGSDDILAIAKGISDYHIGETAGFPFSRTTMKIGKMDCVIATTLESNVTELHQFLYQDESYTPSSSVKKISDKISEVSGITEPGANAPSGGGSQKKNSQNKKETAPPETAPPETTPEETTESTTEESTTEAVETSSTAAEKPTDEHGSLIGPGAEIKEPSKETTKAAENQKETSSENGPNISSEGPKAQPEEPAGPGEADAAVSGPGVS